MIVERAACHVKQNVDPFRLNLLASEARPLSVGMFRIKVLWESVNAVKPPGRLGALPCLRSNQATNPQYKAGKIHS